MSFILDALRKSDQQRQRAAKPVTLAVQSPPAMARESYLPGNVLLALVLLAVGILLGWLRPWPHSAEAPAVPAPQAVARPLASAPAIVAANTPTPVAVASPPPMARPQRRDPGTLTVSPALVRPASVEALPMRFEPTLHAPIKEDTAARAMEFSELPPAVQQEIPALTISMLAYASRPGDRMAMINNNLLHQGDQVAPGLALEQITPDGLVLRYKEFRFHRGVH